MREIVCLVAPAVLMLVLVRTFTKRKTKILGFIFEFYIYTVINNACVILILGPFHKVGLILGDHGEISLFYGGVAIVTSIAIAIVLSFPISFIQKNIRITARIKEEENV